MIEDQMTDKKTKRVAPVVKALRVVLITLLVLYGLVFISGAIAFVVEVLPIKRIGSRGDDYDKLLREFSDAVQKAMSLTGILLAEAPQETRRHFESRYMRLMSEDLDSFLALCYDLSWYKNWLIDHPARDPH